MPSSHTAIFVLPNGDGHDQIVSRTAFRAMYVSCCKAYQMVATRSQEVLYCALCGERYEPDYTAVLHEENSEE